MALTLWKNSDGKLIKNDSGQLIKCDQCPCDTDKPIYLRVTAKGQDPFALDTCFDHIGSSELGETVSELSTKISAPIYFADTFNCAGWITDFEDVAITVTVELFIDKNGERVLYDKASFTSKGGFLDEAYLYSLLFNITVTKVNSGYTLNIEKDHL